jgi:CRISPR-associated endonuclease Cas2
MKQMKENFYLVLYDITADKVRLAIAKLLEQSGFERIQYSVFCGLHHPENDKKMWQKIKTLVEQQDEPGDKVYVVAVSKKNFRNMKIAGTFTTDIDYLLGEKLTLYF